MRFNGRTIKARRQLVPERVERGIALLDAKEPGWYERINLGKLNLASPCQCVLGQLELAVPRRRLRNDRMTSPYARMRRRLRLFDRAERTRRSAEDYGFLAEGWRDDEGAYNTEYRLLTAQWRKRIRELRAERRAAAPVSAGTAP